MKFSPYSDKVFEILSDLVEQYYDCSIEVIYDKDRHQWVHKLRCLCIHLYNLFTKETNKQIGERFHRNESSIFYSVLKSNDYYEEDESFRYNYNLFKSKLEELL